MGEVLLCRDCPRCKDVYPGKLDHNGDHFCICGMGGNKVYPEPRKVKRVCGSGYLHYGYSSCGLYKTFEESFSSMNNAQKRNYCKGDIRYKKVEEGKEKHESI